MTKLFGLFVISIVVLSTSLADEVFTATANTGVQSVGAIIDLEYPGSHLSWYNNFTWYELNGTIYWTGQPTQNSPAIGDSGASFGSSSIASNWSLVNTNWEQGYGYAVMDVDTDHAPGIYAVGNVNCSGAVIWVILL